MPKRDCLATIDGNAIQQTCVAPAKKIKGAGAKNEKKALPAPCHMFDNPQRIQDLYDEIVSDKSLEDIQAGMIKVMSAKNKDLVKKVMAGRPTVPDSTI